MPAKATHPSVAIHRCWAQRPYQPVHSTQCHQDCRADAGKRAKLSFGDDEEAGGPSNGVTHNALPPPDDATRESVLQSRHYRGQRIETPTHTGCRRCRPTDLHKANLPTHWDQDSRGPIPKRCATPNSGGVKEKARSEIKARERESRREGLTARTDHDRHSRRDGGSDRSRESREDYRRGQHRDSGRDRDRFNGRERDSRGDRQRDWERDRRSGRPSDWGRGSEQAPSERRGGSSWEESTPLRSAPRDEWEETPARAGSRAGSAAPSQNPYSQRGGSTPLRGNTSSRGVLVALQSC